MRAKEETRKAGSSGVQKDSYESILQLAFAVFPAFAYVVDGIGQLVQLLFNLGSNTVNVDRLSAHRQSVGRSFRLWHNGPKHQVRYHSKSGEKQYRKQYANPNRVRNAKVHRDTAGYAANNFVVRIAKQTLAGFNPKISTLSRFASLLVLVMTLRALVLR